MTCHKLEFKLSTYMLPAGRDTLKSIILYNESVNLQGWTPTSSYCAMLAY